MSAVGTFETCRARLAMSFLRGGPEVAGRGSIRRDRPISDVAGGFRRKRRSIRCGFAKYCNSARLTQFEAVRALSQNENGSSRRPPAWWSFSQQLPFGFAEIRSFVKPISCFLNLSWLTIIFVNPSARASACAKSSMRCAMPKPR
jgi:hypothetical protein